MADRDPQEPDGVAYARDALLSLEEAPPLDPARSTDPDYLADVLLDVARQFDAIRFLQLFTSLQAERLDDLARDVCEREYLLLDPRDVAEEAIVKVFLREMTGDRKRPFSEWAHELVTKAAHDAASQPERAVFPKEIHLRGNPRVASELAYRSNCLQTALRRIIWLAWVERRDLRTISSMTGIPLERTEWLLATILERAVEAASTADGTSFDESESDAEEDGHDV